MRSSLLVVTVFASACIFVDLDGKGGDPVDPGECPVSVPEQVTVLEDGGSADGAGAVVIVCEGSAEVNGADALVFVAAGATATVNGADAAVYVEDGGAVEVNGFDVEVYRAEGAEVSANGVAIVETVCDEVFTDAPC